MFCEAPERSTKSMLSLTTSDLNDVKRIGDKANPVAAGRHLFRAHLSGVMNWRVLGRIPLFISAHARVEEYWTCDVSGDVAGPESDRAYVDLDDGPRRRIY